MRAGSLTRLAKALNASSAGESLICARHFLNGNPFSAANQFSACKSFSAANQLSACKSFSAANQLSERKTLIYWQNTFLHINQICANTSHICTQISFLNINHLSAGKSLSCRHKKSGGFHHRFFDWHLNQLITTRLFPKKCFNVEALRLQDFAQTAQTFNLNLTDTLTG